MSAELTLQQALVEALRADAGVAALLAEHPYGGSPSLAAVFEYVPQVHTPEDSDRFPYVVVGDSTAVPFDTDDIDGQEHTVILHIWDRYRGMKRVRQLQAAIYDALHNVALAVSGQNVVMCLFDFSGSVPDPDVETQHGVTRFRIVTQQG